MPRGSEAHKLFVFVIIQFLDRTNCHETARELERETGYFFNLKYFEDCFVRGNFEEAEYYLTGFTQIHDNLFTVNVLLELYWQKFLGALHENQRTEAQLIIDDDLRQFRIYHPDMLSFAMQLVTMPDFRLHPDFVYFGEPQQERMARLEFLRINLEMNPLLAGKIQYAPPPSPSPPPPPQDA